MANKDQLRILRRGVKAWDTWRADNLDAEVDLRGANLIDADLNGADLNGADLNGADLTGAKLGSGKLGGASLIGAKLMWANLIGANLSGAKLVWADLRGADLVKAKLVWADLRGANLVKADLRGANLIGANLIGANLSEAKITDADLSNADLSKVSLVEANLVRTKLTGCRIYGISAWNLKLEGSTQNDLIITPDGESVITVDDLEVAQFVYFLLYNANIRRVIDTMTSRVVLILGRFTDDRKPTLNAIKDDLRNSGYVPIMFDFEGSVKRTTEETITLIARLARFVIADITDPKSVIQEISCIVKDLPSVPIKPILLAGHEPWGMSDHAQCFPSFLEIYRYQNTAELLLSFKENVLDSVEKWIEEHPRLGSK